MKRFMGTLVAVAVVGAMALAASASAQTVSPAGPFTAKSSKLVIYFGNLNVGCEANIQGSVTSAGTGTTSSIGLSKCQTVESTLWGNGFPAVVTPLSQWEFTISKGSGTTEVTSFKNIVAKVAFEPGYPSCTFEVTGTAVSTSPTATISSWGFVKETATPRLYTRNVSPTCQPASLNPGPYGWLTGTLSLGTPLQVTH